MLRTRTASGKHGTFTYHSDDRFLGASLRIYGEYSEGEVDFYASALRPTDNAVEVGANIGALTIPLARRCARVLAFEPQPDNFKLLELNLERNGVKNAVASKLALGAENKQVMMPSLAEIDKGDEWGMIGNYGIAEIGHGSCRVNMGLLDNVLRLAPIDFIKLDCEGSELEVLKGAEKTIERDRPLLYVENDRSHKSAALIEWLKDHGYSCYWHKPFLFNINNFNRHFDNIFGASKSTNMICTHGHKLEDKWLKDEVA